MMRNGVFFFFFFIIFILLPLMRAPVKLIYDTYVT